MSLVHALTLDNLEKIVQILAILIGGALTYVKFFKGRIYNLRLEPKMSGTAICKDGISYLTTTAQLKNIGTSKVEIEQRGSALRVLASKTLPNITKAQSAEWTHHGTFEVFTAHKWIESGETIEEQHLIAIPSCDHLAFRLELRIVAKGISWKALKIVGLELVSPTQDQPATQGGIQ